MRRTLVLLTTTLAGDRRRILLRPTDLFDPNLAGSEAMRAGGSRDRLRRRLPATRDGGGSLAEQRT